MNITLNSFRVNVVRFAGIYFAGISFIFQFLLISISVQDCSYANETPVYVNLSMVSFTEDALRIRATIVNHSDKPILLLRWHLPHAGKLYEPLFVVKDSEGRQVPYTGILVKRPEPTKDDYLLLKSGEEISYDVNLTMFYKVSSQKRLSIVVDTRYLDGKVSDAPDLNQQSSISITSSELQVGR